LVPVSAGRPAWRPEAHEGLEPAGVEIIKTETAVSVHAVPPNIGARASIEERVTLTIWYNAKPLKR
jgi:hypothetical protein